MAVDVDREEASVGKVGSKVTQTGITEAPLHHHLPYYVTASHLLTRYFPIWQRPFSAKATAEPSSQRLAFGLSSYLPLCHFSRQKTSKIFHPKIYDGDKLIKQSNASNCFCPHRGECFMRAKHRLACRVRVAQMDNIWNA